MAKICSESIFQLFINLLSIYVKLQCTKQIAYQQFYIKVNASYSVATKLVIAMYLYFNRIGLRAR
jgi:hypothetical protein